MAEALVEENVVTQPKENRWSKTLKRNGQPLTDQHKAPVTIGRLAQNVVGMIPVNMIPVDKMAVVKRIKQKAQEYEALTEEEVVVFLYVLYQLSAIGVSTFVEDDFETIVSAFGYDYANIVKQLAELVK